MKKIIINVIGWLMIGLSVASLIYPMLPPEMVENLQLDQYRVLTFGGTTGILGGASISFMQIANSMVSKSAANNMLVYKDHLELRSKVDVLQDKIDTLIEKNERLERQNKRMIKLLEANLKVKASNRFLDKEAKEIIEGAIHEQE